MKCPKCQSDNPETQKFCGECATPLPSAEDIAISPTKTLKTPAIGLTKGTTFASRYEVIEELGKGGMGRVYKALDKEINEEVAIKLLKPEIASDESTVERFRNELKFARKISHKNVCRMYHLAKEEETPYITMEYVPGEDLKSLVKRKGKLADEEAIFIAKQVCEGLVEAHRLGVMHRDLKPQNIMIDKEGDAKIMDFGIARSIEAPGVTQSGVMIGTPDYMSPEQAEGEEADQRSDIYALGVILYEMVTGSVPFKGDTAFSVALKHKSKLPSDPKKLNPEASEELSKLILICMEKNRDRRYQTAGELLSELDKTEKGIPIAVRIPLKRRLEINWKSILLYGGVPLLLILIIAGGAYFFIGGGEEIDSVTVLPFSIVGGDSEDHVFCHGLVETLTSKLTQLEQFQRRLFVLPSIDVHEFEITSPSEAERVFRVTLAVKGSFKRIGDMFSLTLKLVDTKTQRELKSQVMTDHFANISTLQEDAIFKLVEMLEVEIEPQIRSILTSGGTTIPGAYESYLQGLGYMERNEKEENLETAISLFKRAIEQDLHFALAHGGLGKAYWRKYKQTKNSELLEKARLSCTKAVEISDHLASVHVILGITYSEAGQYEDAIKELQQALLLDPVNFGALQELGEVYENLGRLEKAEETYKQAIKLKPSYWLGYSRLGYFYYIYGRTVEAEKMYSRSIVLATENVLDYNNLIAIYYLLGQYDSATTMFEKSIAIKPTGDAYSNMGLISFMQNRYADALAMYEKAIELGEDYHVIWGNLADSYRYTPGYKEKAPEAYQRAIQSAEKRLEIDLRNAQLRSSLAVYYAKSGDYKNALAEVSRARKLAPNDVPILLDCILVFEIVNQRDQTIRALQEYIARGGSMEEVLDHPDLSGLRADPRFQQLVKE